MVLSLQLSSTLVPWACPVPQVAGEGDAFGGTEWQAGAQTQLCEENECAVYEDLWSDCLQRHERTSESNRGKVLWPWIGCNE